MPGADRGEIHVARFLCIDGREDMIVERALVVIGIRGARMGGKQLPGQPEHVVGIAGLRTFAAFQHASKILRVVEVFGNAVAAKSNTPFAGDIFPEEACAGLGFLVAGERGNAFEADHLGNLRVRMLAGELILMALQRIKNGLVAEATREAQILLVPGDGVHVRQHLVHAAVFLPEHALHLLIREAGRDGFAPVTTANQDFAGLLVAGEPISIPQPGEGLVQVIPRHPLPVYHFYTPGGDGLP